MNTKNIALLILLLSLSFLYSCEEDEHGENETKISSYNDDESHKNGQDCMNCHVNGGSGEGWFMVAGSVYESGKSNPYPNATVKLYTEPAGNGDLVKTVEVDGKGNFYTTEAIDFSNALYVGVENLDGVETYMNTPLPNGSCNSCHGATTGKIGI